MKSADAGKIEQVLANVREMRHAGWCEGAWNPTRCGCYVGRLTKVLSR